jgi:N-acetylmuramoyl-L-alanine amidase
VGTPGVSSFGVSPSSEVVYVVQQGDTLYSIGRRYGVSADAIRIRNGLASNLIVPGQRLTIPAQ